VEVRMGDIVKAAREWDRLRKDSLMLDALLDVDGDFIVMRRKPDRLGPVSGVLGWQAVSSRSDIAEVLGKEEDEDVCERLGCDEPKAYDGARFCGAACCALYEMEDSNDET
jgi:hypothetical protein